MDSPKYLYGRMHFEDGYRPVLMKRGTKYFHAFFVDSSSILRRYVLFKEEKFFDEYANSVNNLKEIKRIARFMRGKSRISGMKREMTKATKAVFKEILEYKL
jgi:hypothetical protein